jgi:hypothetical protein
MLAGADLAPIYDSAMTGMPNRTCLRAQLALTARTTTHRFETILATFMRERIISPDIWTQAIRSKHCEIPGEEAAVHIWGQLNPRRNYPKKWILYK